MKKLPCPGVYLVPDTEGSDRTVLHFEWDSISFQMFDDEALRMAREIHDALQALDEELWEPTHKSVIDANPHPVKLIHSPDDGGYYWSRYTGLRWETSAKVYPSGEDARKALRNNRVRWES